jgi:hypothetical protein
MADKEIVAEIRRRREAWPSMAAETLRRSTQDLGTQALPNGLANTCAVLVDELRAVAELYGRAKMRGAKGEIDELHAAARVFEALAAGLRRTDGPPAAPARGGPSLIAEWCGDQGDHGPHDYPVPREEGGDRDGYKHCTGHHERDTAGLDALIAERSARDGMIINPAAGPDFTGGAFTEAYLRGEASDIPGSPPLGPGSIPPAAPDAIERALQPTSAQPPPAADPFDDPAPIGWSSATTNADGYRLPGNVPPVFDDPAPRRGSIGKRISWGDLRDMLGKDRRGAGLPVHLSHSQMNTIEECGLKYVMQRDEQLGVVEIPQWALIGGNAFHAAVEWFERMVAEVGQLQRVKDRLLTFARERSPGAQAAEAGELLWQWAFGQLITETALKSPVPQDQWRASKQGAEGYTFWLINGGDYVQRYLDARLAELGGAGWRRIRKHVRPIDEAGQIVAEPMIEWEYMTDVEGVPFKGVIDQVWELTQQHGEMRAGDLLIDDCKSGAKVGPDTRQLGEYALWLSRFGGGEDRRIWGRFYDARRGTWTEPIDLLATHSLIELETRVAGADLKKQHGMFTPNRTNFCGGCPVKHACPIFATTS